MKTTALLFVLAFAVVFAAPAPAHAQMLGDDGTVYNRDLPADQCPTYDSCSMAPGGGADPNSNFTAGGLTSCSTYDRCLECGTDAETNRKTCFYVWRSASCQCTTTTSYDPGIGQNVIHCSASGTCTHRS